MFYLFARCHIFVGTRLCYLVAFATALRAILLNYRVQHRGIAAASRSNSIAVYRDNCNMRIKLAVPKLTLSATNLLLLLSSQLYFGLRQQDLHDL